MSIFEEGDRMPFGFKEYQLATALQCTCTGFVITYVLETIFQCLTNQKVGTLLTRNPIWHLLWLIGAQSW